MIKAVIFGGSGYTGFELLRILALHPEVEVVGVTSRQHKGAALSEVFPSLAGFHGGLRFTDPGAGQRPDADVGFCALPHGASQQVVPGLMETCRRVVDLSADFRLKDPGTYGSWYGPHKATDLLREAVYGLPELHREEIGKARLVANPGCYPTGAILALAPLVRVGLVEEGSIVVDSKSGVSGAGRGGTLETSFVEVAGGFKAYKIGTHRHTPEMAQELSALSGRGVDLTFTPHLLPVSRGILTTAYATLKEGYSTARLHGLYSQSYRGEPFIRVMDEGGFPDIGQVRCSNYCDMGVWGDEGRKKVVVISAIDNLVKGAAGQAVQNMNILFGLDETTGLRTPPATY
ncbi:MAG: N-acetyl-gamma-glutamyl-phosphate reductase [Thermodesulfobacteriota bacterium]